MTEKKEVFRQALSDKYCWFAEFNIGENHLRNGDRDEALEAYRRSYEDIPKVMQGKGPNVDNWVIRQLRNRLGQLSTADKPEVENEESF